MIISTDSTANLPKELYEKLNIKMIPMQIILNGETYNMFYISPYFISTLPVFDIIQQNVPYILYLLIYIIVISIGAATIFEIAYFIKKMNRKKGKSN